MSETATTETPAQVIEAPSLTRNGITKVLSPNTFGKNHNTLAGETYFYPAASVATFQEDSTFIGLDYIVGNYNRHARKVFGAIYEDSLFTEEDFKAGRCTEEQVGQLNYDAWLEEANEFTSKGGAKLSDLCDDRDELQDQLGAFVDAYMKELTEGGGADSPEAHKLQASMVETRDKIKPIKEAISAMEAKYALRVEKRKQNAAVKEAEAAKKKAEAEAAAKAGGNVHAKA